MLKYKYQETEEIRKLLEQIEAVKIVFKSLTPSVSLEENIRRESLLKSSLYSAKIEGNKLDIADVSYQEKSKDKAKVEVFNLLKGYKYIFGKKISRTLSVEAIKKIHHLVMNNLISDAGYFRQGPGAIFNQSGVAIYLAPPHIEVKKLMKELVVLINNLEQPTPVKAAIGHFLLEKIHPFTDGNGRVGRLLSSYIMNNGGFGFKGMVSVEEAINQKRDEYYEALTPFKNVSDFVVFSLNSFFSQAKATLSKINVYDNEGPEKNLLPRRKEIYLVVKDHPMCSFNFIQRRFMGVNLKTLHYDLKKLQDENLVVKVGKTRGSLYKIV